MKGFARIVMPSLRGLLVAAVIGACGRSSLEPLPVFGGPDAAVESGFDGTPPEGDVASGCKSDRGCESTPSTPYCLTPPGTCVACETPSQCPAGDTCLDNACVPACGTGQSCPAGLSCCGAACVDLTRDPQDCAACGQACPSGDACVDSRCQVPESCNGGAACAPDDQCCASGCADTNSDPSNCGKCGVACAPGDTCVAGGCLARVGCNGGPACTTGLSCCSSGCVDTQTDPANCGGCAMPCDSPGVCVMGSCVESEGVFNPTVNPTYLSPGVHSYTSIDIPQGITVYVAGGGPLSGTLTLNATGDILVDGTIDLSGGPGTQNTITSESTQSGSAGSGGYTGEPYQSAAPSSACSFVSGNPGLLGFASSGTAGTCGVYTGCQAGMNGPEIFSAIIADYGGGAGVFTGYRAYGGGGGGPAGGAPGHLGAAYPGEEDCTGVSAGGGATDGHGGVGGGAPYDGSPGVSGETQCKGIGTGVPPAYVGGGAGGSIGVAAAADLAVATTFQTGSSGGGGSADYLNRPQFGGSSGGGGGGGALKLSTPTSISIGGQLLANGGAGGDAFIGTGKVTGCNPQPGAGGGGGSGGVIFLSAPSITTKIGAVISAAGGSGGAESEFATGGGGGAGGLGRVRLSVTPSTCSLEGTFTPPAPGTCAATSTRGSTYIGVYPN